MQFRSHKTEEDEYSQRIQDDAPHLKFLMVHESHPPGTEDAANTVGPETNSLHLTSQRQPKAATKNINTLLQSAVSFRYQPQPHAPLHGTTDPPPEKYAIEKLVFLT